MHEISQKLYKAYVLVCENRRDDGRQSCGVTEPGLRMALKDAVKAAGIPVRVVSTSCLDHCNEGPTIMIAFSETPPYTLDPQTITYGSVHIDDVPEIVRKLKHDMEAL